MTYNISFTYCGLWLGYCNMILSWRYYLLPNICWTSNSFMCTLFLRCTEMSAIDTILTKNNRRFHSFFYWPWTFYDFENHLVYWPKNASPQILISISCYVKITFQQYGDGELMLNWTSGELMLNRASGELMLNWSSGELMLNWASGDLMLNWSHGELLLN